MLNLIIQTQYKENYAAHDEDYVHGVSEPYWKFKGGSSYLITDIDFLNTEYLEGLIEETKFLHSYENAGSMEYVLNWELIDENDVSNHMSDWETPYVLEKNSDGFWESSKVTENGDYGYMIEDILRKKETWVYTENGVDGVSKYIVSYELVDGTVCASNEELGAYLEEKGLSKKVVA